MIYIIFFILITLFGAGSYILIFRDAEVQIYRNKIFDCMIFTSRNNFNRTGNWDFDFRLREFKKVSSIEMSLKFWKPLDSFYEDKRFYLDENFTKIRRVV